MENTRKKIVITDDDMTNLASARDALMGEYGVYTVTSGAKLLSLLEKVTPDLILLDIEMPEMRGYEVIKILKSNERTADIPVIFLSAQCDVESELEGLDLGAVDYISKPFSRRLLLKRIELHLFLEEHKKGLKKTVEEKTETISELQSTILKTMATLVERRDDITGGHIERTQKYLKNLMKFMLESGVYKDEISTWDIDLVIMSSQLHDVGKISIKDEILLKPGKLSADEYEVIKTHAGSGADIIRGIEETTSENAFLKHAELFAESHHEKWDGTGYPFGLKGVEIPLQGRLMAIVDVYDALTNERPYKKAFTHEQAVGIIKDGLGTHFDPRITEVFLENEKNFR